MNLAKEIRAFDLRHRYLRTPAGADWMCSEASALFCQRVPGARVLHLVGTRRPFPRSIHTEWPVRDDCFYHVVVLFGAITIDWTRRQLDPFGKHPFIQTIGMTRAQWHRVGLTEQSVGI